MVRYVVGFGVSGVVLGTLAVQLALKAAGLWWLLVAVEGQLSFCFLALATVYGLRSAGIPIEEISFPSPWPSVMWTILFPYVAVGGLVLNLSRWFDREGLLNRVVPGLYIGRRPFPSERTTLTKAGIDAVLNLCWEFPGLSRIEEERGLETARVPILDGSAPSRRQFQEACARVAQWRAEGRVVLIHCAQGHGRTSTIAAAVLCRLGLASSVEDALDQICAARPRARPSPRQRSALDQFVSRLNHE